MKNSIEAKRFASTRYRSVVTVEAENQHDDQPDGEALTEKVARKCK
ncbi:hypothetical protein [Gemmatimonas groenlandica]|uniref:Uncharacterized protein n=1 Tax=Gemmatimonas groenlandica TaxID=2732249 RepID=A0A6M4IUE3_9BACT|nr:hypothetical protein [Gemmatimonas groenlandica]QJR37157.1 hypothetical protein HKW67_17350 [Gemmatimonas groenlandica]